METSLTVIILIPKEVPPTQTISGIEMLLYSVFQYSEVHGVF